MARGDDDYHGVWQGSSASSCLIRFGKDNSTILGFGTTWRKGPSHFSKLQIWRRLLNVENAVIICPLIGWLEFLPHGSYLPNSIRSSQTAMIRGELYEPIPQWKAWVLGVIWLIVAGYKKLEELSNLINWHKLPIISVSEGGQCCNWYALKC